MLKPCSPLQPIVVPEIVEPTGGGEGDLVVKESVVDVAPYDNLSPSAERLAYYDNVHILEGGEVPSRSPSASFRLAEQQSLNSASHVQFLVSSSVLNPVREAWSRPDLSRDTANRLLGSQRLGAFVVYDKGASYMAVRTQNSIKHYPIVRMDSIPPRFRLALDDTQPWHFDIISLVEFYQTPRHNVPFVLSREPLLSSRGGGKRSQTSLDVTPLEVSEFGNGDGYDYTRRPSRRTEEDLRSFSPLVLPKAEAGSPEFL